MFNSPARGNGRLMILVAMKLDLVDYTLIFMIVVFSLSVLTFAVGYLWSVANKHYTNQRLQRNNELWLNYLFNDQCDDMMNAIHSHPDDFLVWVVSLPEGNYEESVIVFETYLNLLNSCSWLAVQGIVSEAMFWKKMEKHLKAIVACKELYEFIISGYALEALRVKLLEQKQREKERADACH